jgi:acyl dehydratase
VIDRSLLGRRTESVVLAVEAGAIRRFAEALGESDPVYFDEAAARAAGHERIPAPPTFATSLRPPDIREGLGVDLRRLLHGEQSFELRRPLRAGDRLRVHARVADVSEKTGRSGVMDVLVTEQIGEDADTGEVVFVGRSTVLIRR